MIDVLIVVTGKKSGPLLKGLAQGLGRAECSWSVFLTNDAVLLVCEHWFAGAMHGNTETVMCRESWSAYQSLQASANHDPAILGSQTDHSSMVGNATRVVSL